MSQYIDDIQIQQFTQMISSSGVKPTSEAIEAMMSLGRDDNVKDFYARAELANNIYNIILERARKTDKDNMRILLFQLSFVFRYLAHKFFRVCNNTMEDEYINNEKFIRLVSFNLEVPESKLE